MSLTEFDQDLYDRCRREEGYEDGVADGISQGAHDKAVETARNPLAEGIPAATVIKCTGLTEEELKEIVK